MAYFYDYEIGAGWWWYFQLMIAAGHESEDKEFIQDFIDEMFALVQREGKPYGEINKVKKRIPMQRM